MAAPITNERNETLGAVLVFHDIIERRQMESQLLQMQKMEAVGQLAAGVAHNFNNILTAVIGYASMVIEALPPDHPAIADLIGIQGAVQRATKLTGELLTFSRRRPTQPVPLDLNKLIMELHNLLRHLLPRNIKLEFSLQPDLGWTEADSAQLEQVLVNLALNARDVTTANFVLEPGTARPHPELKPGNYLVLSLSDTGVGMTEAVKAHIFEPFFTTKEVGRGTGLGLATCLGIIKQHDGYITVDSQPGQGATFKIYLPQTEAEAPSI
jgi:signal transduction histidine kinase